MENYLKSEVLEEMNNPIDYLLSIQQHWQKHDILKDYTVKEMMEYHTYVEEQIREEVNRVCQESSMLAG